MLMSYIVPAIAGILLVAFIIWFFKRNWSDFMNVLFGSLDEQGYKEKAD